jgi:hypothetical protein
VREAVDIMEFCGWRAGWTGAEISSATGQPRRPVTEWDQFGTFQILVSFHDSDRSEHRPVVTVKLYTILATMLCVLKTEETEFEVVGVENNHRWLRILHGEDSGMRLSVPVRDPAHDGDDIEFLRTLTHGDIVKAVLVSENEEYPNWKVDSIEAVREGSEVTSAASSD